MKNAIQQRASEPRPPPPSQLCFSTLNPIPHQKLPHNLACHSSTAVMKVKSQKAKLKCYLHEPGCVNPGSAFDHGPEHVTFNLFIL